MNHANSSGRTSTLSALMPGLRSGMNREKRALSQPTSKEVL